MTTEISNRDEQIDSRDVIERINELELDAERECAWFLNDGKPKREWCCNTHMYAGGEAGIEGEKHPEKCEFAGLDEDAQNELDCLNALDSEGRDTFGASEWESGVQLISDNKFEDHARELAADIGAINDDMQWPATCIDWERAAEELQQDYSSVEFGSQYYDDYVTFWGRA